MNFFNDDPFDEIIKEFFGKTRTSEVNSPKIKRYTSEQDERKTDYIETESEIYIVFELEGYSKEDISVKIQGKELIVKASKANCNLSKVQNYLSRKLCEGIILRKFIPKKAKIKSMKHLFKNGVLEVCFKKN